MAPPGSHVSGPHGRECSHARRGLILPWLTGIAPVLTPLAASGLVILQALAILVHLRRGEAKVTHQST